MKEASVQFLLQQRLDRLLRNFRRYVPQKSFSVSFEYMMPSNFAQNGIKLLSMPGKRRGPEEETTDLQPNLEASVGLSPGMGCIVRCQNIQLSSVREDEAGQTWQKPPDPDVASLGSPIQSEAAGCPGR